jgi:hypothetical protein
VNAPQLCVPVGVAPPSTQQAARLLQRRHDAPRAAAVLPHHVLAKLGRLVDHLPGVAPDVDAAAFLQRREGSALAAGASCRSIFRRLRSRRGAAGGRGQTARGRHRTLHNLPPIQLLHKSALQKSGIRQKTAIEPGGPVKTEALVCSDAVRRSIRCPYGHTTSEFP